MYRQKDYPLTASVWYNMRQRVKKNYDGYYGSVKMDSRWESFHNFVEDMGERPSKEYELDRIDNNGNYEPGNCRWATRLENQKNRNISRLYNGKTLAEWSRECSINEYTLRHRVVNLKMSITEAVSTPLMRNRA